MRRLADMIVSVMLRGVVFMFSRLRHPRHPIAARILGRVILSGKKKTVLRNMHAVLGTPPSGKGSGKQWSTYCQYVGRTLIELDWLIVQDPDIFRRHIVLEGEEALRSALSKGNGAMMLFSHFGNVGSLSAIGLHGYDFGMAARSLGLPSLDLSYQRKFDRQSTQWILTDRSMLLRGRDLLKRNGLFAVAIDFSVKNARSVWMEFGHSFLRVNCAPILLALQCDAPIFYASVRRLPDGRDRITIVPLSDSPTEEFEPSSRSIASRAIQLLQTDLSSSPATWWLWADCVLNAQDD